MSVFDKSGSNESEEQQIQLGADETLGETPTEVEEPIQVQAESVVFVAQEDFEGSINRENWTFKKGVRYDVTRDQANTWVQAEKGYIVE